MVVPDMGVQTGKPMPRGPADTAKGMNRVCPHHHKATLSCGRDANVYACATRWLR